MKKIEVFRVMETTYEDGSYWVEYIVNGKFGCEIVYNIENLEKIISEEEVIELIKKEYSKHEKEFINKLINSKETIERCTPIFNARKYYENLFNNDIELNEKLASKPKVSVCSSELQLLIEECRQSDNEMWFVDMDYIEEEFGDDEEIKEKYINEIQEEVNKLGLAEYVEFFIDGDNAITVYGGIITQFLFIRDEFEFNVVEERISFNGKCKTTIYENEYYKLKKNVKNDYTNISIEAKDKIDNYRHDIYVIENSDTFEITGFEIQTTAYGTLSIDGINKVVDAYNIAINTVKELEKMFLQ